MKTFLYLGVMCLGVFILTPAPTYTHTSDFVRPQLVLSTFSIENLEQEIIKETQAIDSLHLLTSLNHDYFKRLE